MTTSTVISTAEAAKQAALEAANAQKAAQDAQAVAEAAQLEAKLQRDAAFREYADATLAAFRESSAAASQAIKTAQAAFEKAVIEGKNEGAAYARLQEARADNYVLQLEKYDVQREQGRDPSFRATPPSPKFAEECNEILRAYTREMLADKIDDYRERKEAFITQKVGQ